MWPCSCLGRPHALAARQIPTMVSQARQVANVGSYEPVISCQEHLQQSVTCRKFNIRATGACLNRHADKHAGDAQLLKSQAFALSVLSILLVLLKTNVHGMAGSYPGQHATSNGKARESWVEAAQHNLQCAHHRSHDDGENN